MGVMWNMFAVAKKSHPQISAACESPKTKEHHTRYAQHAALIHRHFLNKCQNFLQLNGATNMASETCLVLIASIMNCK